MEGGEVPGSVHGRLGILCFFQVNLCFALGEIERKSRVGVESLPLESLPVSMTRSVRSLCIAS